MMIRVATAEDMPAVFALRVEVFVDEQGVSADIELDEHDAHARHILAQEDGIVVGCARVLIEGDDVHIGRLAVKKYWRNRGVGTDIMKYIMQQSISDGCRRIWFNAQLHAAAFYEGLGFVRVGDTFFEAGIEHIRMERCVLTARLMALCDQDFRAFNARLLPTVDTARIFGVKTPMLRRLCRQMIKDGEAEIFLRQLPHTCFEEDQLHALLIGELREGDRALCEVCRFLPYIDNWASCDQLVPKALARTPERLLPHIERWLTSEHAYTVRFAVVTLMRWFSDTRFDARYAAAVAAVAHEDYYVRMACAWYFANLLAKQYDAVYPYFAEGQLPMWVHNKAIQKARESYRVSDEHKAALQQLVRRGTTDT